MAQNLSGVVFEQVFPHLVQALAAASGAPLSEVRQGLALIFLYCLLFVLYAEDRGLLPVNEIATTTMVCANGCGMRSPPGWTTETPSLPPSDCFRNDTCMLTSWVTPTALRPTEGCENTSGSTTTGGPISLWDTGRRRKSSTVNL